MAWLQNAFAHWKTTIFGAAAAVCGYLLANHIGNPTIVSALTALFTALTGASASDAGKH
jgi:hypothetical protein